MSQSSPPEDHDFLSKTVANVKDMQPPLRFAIVFFALLIFALLGNVVFPDAFVPLVYLLSIGVLLLYLYWEFQQRKAAESERRDQRFAKKDDLDHDLDKDKLRYKYDDKEKEREHKRKLKELELRVPPSKPSTNDEKASAPAEDMHFDYLNWVRTQVSELSLQGVDPEATQNEQEGKLHLDQVYTALLTTDSETGEKIQNPERLGREDKRLSAVAQLDRHKRLVLLGDPGSGKSTFVNFVAMCLVFEAMGEPEKGVQLLTAPLPDDKGEDQEERQPWTHGTLLPLRIILRDFAARGLPHGDKPATVNHLWQFVQAELEQAELGQCVSFLQAQFKAGQAILLLDGLDEVPEAAKQRQQIKQIVDAFALKYRNCRIVVTSRTYAYQKQDWELDGFKAGLLMPFSVGQIRRFVDGWYRYTAWRRDKEEGWADSRANTLKDAILNQPRLYELAERPLLLTLMASLHAWRMGELPEDRQKLYEETVDLLLNRWERRQRVWDGKKERDMQPSLVEWLKTDRAKVRELLNELAYEAHSNQTDQAGTADVSQKKLLDGLLALNKNPDFQLLRLENYLRDRAGLLAERADGVYTFPHRTFQEYLAACYFVQQDPNYPESLAQLAREEPNKWREVLLLAGTQAGRNQVWYLVNELCGQDSADAVLLDDADLWGAHLAGQVLVETIDPDSPLKSRNEILRGRIQAGLVACLTTKRWPPTERAIAGTSLSFLGEMRPDVACTVPQMVDVPAGMFLMGSDKKKDPQAYNDELKQHQAKTPAYRIGKYPVTNGQFDHFVQADGYDDPTLWTMAGWKQKQKEGWHSSRYGDYSRYNQANQPVVGISWYEAVAYCNWLKKTTGRSFRLPDEAMWEKAARGTDARVYPWGNEWNPAFLNAAETNINRPSAVGIFVQGASPYGAYDMCGNVLEWCSTVYGKDYPFQPELYERELEGTTRRRLRGGAFYYSRQDSRAASRFNDLPRLRFSNVGFRVAEHLSDPDS
ncbi:MAG: SUMF1/EgtB/PvdO family nonheme iron enzyme [Chloroflexi bacterium]|nr:SUMF1/EgtB/PvdO family nonheme iron enzyme [Chloroflexota bacterium]